jgi:hypothetical protein
VFIVPSSLARQGFEEYISGKFPLFFLLPHRNEKSQCFITVALAVFPEMISPKSKYVKRRDLSRLFFLLPTFHLSPKIFCSRKLADKSPLVKGYNRRLTQKFIKLGYE